MRLRATTGDIRALLRLAELEGRAGEADLRSRSFRERRAAARERVPSALLERYEALLQRGRWPAICAVARGHCSGCHLRLPAQLDHEVRSAAGVFTCPYCHRMLYGRERVEGPSGSSSTKRGSGVSAGAAAVPSQPFDERP